MHMYMLKQCLKKFHPNFVTMLFTLHVPIMTTFWSNNYIVSWKWYWNKAFGAMLCQCALYHYWVNVGLLDCVRLVDTTLSQCWFKTYGRLRWNPAELSPLRAIPTDSGRTLLLLRELRLSFWRSFCSNSGPTLSTLLLSGSTKFY